MPEKIQGKVFDRRIAHGIDGDDGQLHPQLLLHLKTVSFQSRLVARIDHVRQIADVTSRLGEGIHVRAGCKQERPAEDKCAQQQGKAQANSTRRTGHE